MAKQTEPDLIEVDREKLAKLESDLTGLADALAALLTGEKSASDADEEEEKPAKGKKPAKEEESADGETELPSLKDIKKVDEDELKALAEKLNLTVDELDEDAIR